MQHKYVQAHRKSIGKGEKYLAGDQQACCRYQIWWLRNLRCEKRWEKNEASPVLWIRYAAIKSLQSSLSTDSPSNERLKQKHKINIADATTSPAPPQFLPCKS